MYDVIVVGARCAGASTATLLARAGHRVLLLDRTSFPSDKLSTHYVHQPTIARLARWGLLDRLRATGCPPMEAARFSLSGVSVTGCAPPVDGIRAGYGPRRYILDSMLATAASEAGAELRERTNVTELLWDGDRVVGVRARTEGGGVFEERGRVVVGADGVDSLVARSVRAPVYADVPSLTCVYYTYWSGVRADWEAYADGRRAVSVVLTHDDRVMVGVQWPREEFPNVRRDIEAAYFAGLRVAAPDVLARLRDGRREERFVGTARVPNFLRRAGGPGWALVGDAGLHKDPIGGHGIGDALTHAELLASRLGAALEGECPVDRAVAEYAAARDEEAMARYQFNVETARLERMPDVVSALRLIRGDEEYTTRFFALIAGIITTDEFFSGDLLARMRADREVPVHTRHV